MRRFARAYAQVAEARYPHLLAVAELLVDDDDRARELVDQGLVATLGQRLRGRDAAHLEREVLDRVALASLVQDAPSVGRGTGDSARADTDAERAADARAGLPDDASVRDGAPTAAEPHPSVFAPPASMVRADAADASTGAEPDSDTAAADADVENSGSEGTALRHAAPAAEAPAAAASAGATSARASARVPPAPAPPTPAPARRESAADGRLRAALGALPPHARAATVLHHVAGRDVHAIADALRIDASRVREALAQGAAAVTRATGLSTPHDGAVPDGPLVVDVVVETAGRS